MPPAGDASAKRPSSAAGGGAPDAKRARVDDLPLPAHPRRAGIPAPTSTSAFVVPDRPSPPLRADDKDGHFVYELGENLTSRYKILSKMGEGTFGRVLECWDRKIRGYVAIKIVRAVQKYRDAAMIELEVLATLEANDRAGRFHCVSLREWFDYRGHVCMVFERLGPSLYDFLRKNAYRPFPARLVRAFGRQLLEATAYLHSLSLVHTDLKPENVLLTSGDYDRAPAGGPRAPARVPRHAAVRVIDFGSATFEDAHHSAVVSTRHYRAPEVILGLGWSYPADLWSAGCILVELATGDALFQTHENLEHLAMMEAVLGAIPPAMARACTGPVAPLFDASGRLDWPRGASSRRSVRAVAKLAKVRAQLDTLADASMAPHAGLLADLVARMLTYDPAARITAAEALAHPFFALPDDALDDAAGAPSIPREPAAAVPAVATVADAAEDDNDDGGAGGGGGGLPVGGGGVPGGGEPVLVGAGRARSENGSTGGPG